MVAIFILKGYCTCHFRWSTTLEKCSQKIFRQGEEAEAEGRRHLLSSDFSMGVLSVLLNAALSPILAGMFLLGSQKSEHGASQKESAHSPKYWNDNCITVLEKDGGSEHFYSVFPPVQQLALASYKRTLPLISRLWQSTPRLPVKRHVNYTSEWDIRLAMNHSNKIVMISSPSIAHSMPNQYLNMLNCE